MTDNVELLPCAHCGHKANLICEGSGSGNPGMRICKTYFFIVCEFCNIRTSYERSKKAMINIWNTRTSDKKLERLIEEVKHHMKNGHDELASAWVLNELEKLK